MTATTKKIIIGAAIVAAFWYWRSMNQRRQNAEARIDNWVPGQTSGWT